MSRTTVGRCLWIGGSGLVIFGIPTSAHWWQHLMIIAGSAMFANGIRIMEAERVH